MKKLLLLCSLLNNLYPTSTELHASKLLAYNNAYAFDCEINLVDCKQACPDLKSLADTLFPMLLNCEYFDNIVHGKVGDGFEACLFNDDAAILIQVNESDIHIEITFSELFNTYLVSAQLAFFFKARYFDSIIVKR